MGAWRLFVCVVFALLVCTDAAVVVTDNEGNAQYLKLVRWLGEGAKGEVILAEILDGHKPADLTDMFNPSLDFTHAATLLRPLDSKPTHLLSDLTARRGDHVVLKVHRRRVYHKQDLLVEMAANECVKHMFDEHFPEGKKYVANYLGAFAARCVARERGKPEILGGARSQRSSIDLGDHADLLAADDICLYLAFDVAGERTVKNFLFLPPEDTQARPTLFESDKLQALSEMMQAIHAYTRAGFFNSDLHLDNAMIQEQTEATGSSSYHVRLIDLADTVMLPSPTHRTTSSSSSSTGAASSSSSSGPAHPLHPSCARLPTLPDDRPGVLQTLLQFFREGFYRVYPDTASDPTLPPVPCLDDWRRKYQELLALSEDAHIDTVRASAVELVEYLAAHRLDTVPCIRAAQQHKMMQQLPEQERRAHLAAQHARTTAATAPVAPHHVPHHHVPHAVPSEAAATAPVVRQNRVPHAVPFKRRNG